MKKIPFSILTLFLLPMLGLAQFTRRPVVDVTANPQSWSNRQANICAQFMAIPRIGLCISGSLNASEASQGNFLIQSTKWGIHAETRIFPFGQPLPMSIGDKKTPYQRKRRGTGCFGAKDNWLEKVASSMIKGVYVAPGFVHQEEQLDFTPLPDKESPISKFNYQIKHNGASLALGCQIRLRHLTLGAGWGVQATRPRWTGPVDIFGNSLFTTTYPWKLNIQHGPRFEVGINF